MEDECAGSFFYYASVFAGNSRSRLHVRAVIVTNLFGYISPLSYASKPGFYILPDQLDVGNIIKQAAWFLPHGCLEEKFNFIIAYTC